MYPLVTLNDVQLSHGDLLYGHFSNLNYMLGLSKRVQVQPLRYYVFNMMGLSRRLDIPSTTPYRYYIYKHDVTLKKGLYTLHPALTLQKFYMLGLSRRVTIPFQPPPTQSTTLKMLGLSKRPSIPLKVPYCYYLQTLWDFQKGSL
jgi:hypothetical protein